MKWKEILRWPEKKGTYRVPWFIFINRLVWMPVFLVGMFFATIGITCMYGLAQGFDFWSENM